MESGKWDVNGGGEGGGINARVVTARPDLLGKWELELVRTA